MITCSNCPEPAEFDYYGSLFCLRHLPRFLTKTEGVLREVRQPEVPTDTVELTEGEPQEEKPVKKRAAKKVVEEPSEAE